jgi:hypothetical protein
MAELEHDGLLRVRYGAIDVVDVAVLNRAAHPGGH